MTKIIVFSDYACPYCYIGLSIAIRLMEEDPDLEVEFYPYLLDPRIPMKGLDTSKFTSTEELNKYYEKIESLGDEYGLKFENKAKKFNTVRLHKASMYAREKNKFFEFSMEAFKYIFELGKNIADPVITSEIALEVGLNNVDMNARIDNGDFDEVLTDAKEQSSIHGIKSVPTFIMDDRKVDILKPYEEIKKEILGL